MEKWTQQQAIAYECAREAITHMMAMYSARIEKEKYAPQPDQKHIASLTAQRSALFRERAELKVTDDEKIAKIRAEYGALTQADTAR